MIADLLNRRSLGSLTSLHDDSLSNFNDAFTIYGHPKVKDVLKAFELLQVIQLPNYRTALKLRAIQRKMQLHRVDARDIVAVMADSSLPPLYEEIGEGEMEPVINDVCLMAERNADTTIVSCADLILTWVLQLFDSNFIGAVKVKQFTTALVIMGAGRLLDKLKYLFDTFKGSDGMLTQQGFSELLTDLLLIPCSVFEEDLYGHSTLVLSAIFECFNQIGHERQKLSLDEFLQWCTKAPFCLSWLFTFHRLLSSEYSVNLTSCSNCGVAPFLGFRYVALHRYTVAICQECMWTGNCEETEFREFGALSQCVNVTVVPMRTIGSTTSVENSNTLSQVQQCLDKRHEMLLSYSKRLDPKTTSHFVSLYETIQSKDDNVEALVGECEDRASKLQRDFHALCKEHSEILKLERKDGVKESFIAWKRRDDMSSRLAIWMSRRNDLYIKQESILQSDNVPLPTVSYNKFGALGSLESVTSEDISHENNIHVSMNGIDKISPKVSVEDSVMVLSKLSLIINNALLQKSFSSTPSKPIKQMSRDTPPLSPLSFENKAASVKITNGTNGLSKENIAHNAPSSQDEAAMTSSEKDVMKEFEDTVKDIMIQEPTSEKTDSPVTSQNDVSSEVTSQPDVTTAVDKEEKEKEEKEEKELVKEDTVEEGEEAVKEESEEAREDGGSEKVEDEEEEEWESEGSWETEDDNTERSQPPDTLNIAGVVSEPECDPPDPVEDLEEDPEDSAPPVPPPRSLLSPQGVSRRATSLKTKSEGDPRMEELRKVTRAASSVHSKSKPSGIPLRTTPTIPGSMPTLSGNSPNLSTSPANTPPPRQNTRIPTPKTNTPDLARLGGTPSSTPEILSRISDHSARSTPEVAAKPRVAPRRGKPGSKPTTPFKGPIVYEGESDSETSTSSSSSSDSGKKSKFMRARSARFARSKATTPNRNAASFRTKKGGSKAQQPLEFFNNFAE